MCRGLAGGDAMVKRRVHAPCGGTMTEISGMRVQLWHFSTPYGTYISGKKAGREYQHDFFIVSALPNAREKALPGSARLQSGGF